MNGLIVVSALLCGFCGGLIAKDLKDVEFARVGGVGLKLDAWLPEDGRARGAVILVHGGGWEAGDQRTYIGPWFQTLTAAGIPWFSIEYRLAPKFAHPAAVEDVEKAVEWVRAHAAEFHVDPRRLVLMGESSGGHLAALATLRGKVRVAGLVSFYGIHDIPRWKVQRGEMPRNISLYLPNASAELLKEASPITYVKRGMPPMLLVHGTADKGVPFAQSTEFCEAAKRVGARCELRLIEDAGHGVENWERETRFQVWKPFTVAWLRRELKIR